MALVQRYVVKPRQDGRGYELSGAGLPFAAWYLDDRQAVDYAHRHGRGQGGKIHVLDSRGHCILTETIEAGGHALRAAGGVHEVTGGPDHGLPLLRFAGWLEADACRCSSLSRSIIIARSDFPGPGCFSSQSR